MKGGGVTSSADSRGVAHLFTFSVKPISELI